MKKRPNQPNNDSKDDFVKNKRYPKRLTLDLTNDMHKQLKRLALENEQPMAEFVRDMLAKELSR